MRKLSSLILVLVLSVSLFGQKSPHGDDFVMSCKDCHKTDGWKVDLKTIPFNHDVTKFPLIGQHQDVTCRACHISLEFTKVQTECNACHTDIHQQTVGLDCARCHTPKSWVVANISQIHQQSSFPLFGPHAMVDCYSCHTNIVPSAAKSGATASLLRFDVIGIECYDCHRINYETTTKPKHNPNKFSFNCTECHKINSFSWTGASTDHSFFPLTEGHAIDECSRCHTSGTYANVSAECSSCHTPNYIATTNPNHAAVGIQNDCATCHTTNPGWKPAAYTHKEPYPLRDAHLRIANECATCHAGNYANPVNTCEGCHITNFNQTTNPNHITAQIATACETCHSQIAWAPATYTHKEPYPLTDFHLTIANDCAACHAGNYTNPVNTCVGCHITNYNATTNPNHVTSQFATACETCHSQVAWAPATFDHNTIYPLIGAHAVIANNCVQCHANGYPNTPNTCVGCHLTNYNQTTNPNHIAALFPTTCADCHTQTAWKPATFDHDGQYFPIYSGKHNGQWNACADCHTNPSNYAVFTCISASCHPQASTNSGHQGVGGYQYNSDACFSCHPNGTSNGFDHAGAGFPLTNGHSAVACTSCHAGGYVGTSPLCASCHTPNYTQTTNPNHTAIGISTDCATCHTTMPGWNPATFPTHNNYYVIAGAHVPVTCANCHNGNYNSTPNTCVGCHLTNFNQTTNPNHISAQFPTTCADCHSQSAWTPATFNHDGLYFPIYSGKHNGQWNTCADCHTNPANYAVYTCTTSCHPQSTMNNQHQGVGGYQYLSSACLACHPTGNAGGSFNHNTSPFPLTGGHATVECALCHASGYTGTSTICASCHTPNYNQTTNPNHATIGISTDCAVCHTTNPGWNPATFPTHSNYFALAGAHVSVSCANCHNGNYNSTPNTCAGCHISNYNQTTNPNHASAQFPTTCADCHTQSAWTPSTFNHDGQYFPIYSGTHNNQWNVCADCHTNPANFAVYTCTSSCHPQSTMTNQHQGVGGFQYVSSACLACHPTGNAGGSFNHNTSPFPLTGGHSTVDCALCHPNGYTGTSTICASCHTPNYNQTTNPNHTTIGISTDCAVCHTTNPGWNPATFPTHNNYYVLAGAHIPLANQCAGCHNGNYNSTPNTCAGCHTDNYNQTTNPNHVTAGFSTACATCHSQTSWVPSTFNHTTIYPLTGGHATIASNCVLCHPNGYSNTPNTCVGCHQTNYNQATNPSHSALGISNNCVTCHTTNPGWAPATFPTHNNYYVLAGAHIPIANQCAGCHNGNYNSTPNTCVGCHLDNFNQTTNPNHVTAGFSTACATCHSQTAWVPSTFNHTTIYPLTGAHATIASNCVLCHPNGYSNTPNTCVGCHQTNYNQATNPSHSALGISNNCVTCHTTNPGWAPATFPTHNNYYVLAGAHVAIANQCADCHNGNYNTTPNTCAGCHINNYNQTTNPNHAAAQFPTTCADCHTQSVWTPSTFNHDAQYFPIYSGRHNNRWNTCAQCHPNPANFAVFTCTTTCHPQSSTNNNHQGINGYSYTSAACYDCHPTGNAGKMMNFNKENRN